jgi:hypothetical protein
MAANRTIHEKQWFDAAAAISAKNGQERWAHSSGDPEAARDSSGERP